VSYYIVHFELKGNAGVESGTGKVLSKTFP